MKGQTGRLESHRITVDGLSMHYRGSVDPVPSQRLPVVLVHGLVASSRYMIPLAEALVPYFRVYAPDLPGFGKSDKPDQVLNIIELADALAAWMAQMGLDRAYLIGNSLGCNVAVEFALRHGARVERLVLQGPTMDPLARTARQQLGRWAINVWRESHMEGSRRIGLLLLKDYTAAGLRRARLTFQHLLRHRIEDKLPHVQLPTLVIRGTRDPIVPREWACQVARLLPQGRLIEIPGATHTINFFAPLRFVRLLRPFLCAAGSRGSLILANRGIKTP